MAGVDPTTAGQSEPMIGSYRLVQPLGTGGMSSVFRAHHAETGVEVAVKILPRNLARNRTLLQRFIREARSAEALEHPNIVAIYDHGVDHGQYYLVLEFVDGGDLHDRVRKHGPMPVVEAIAAIRAVAEGLEFAASRGLIHRDIKPANLLLSASGTVKIADLGLALQAEAEDERVTREGTTVGTVDYMSPEQARDSRGTSERSDIYSLGCTLYFLLTGQPPYPGGDVTEKLTRHFTAPPPDPAVVRPGIPANCSALVRKMMAKKPEHRFANYQELIAAVDALGLTPAHPPPPAEILDALIDDEDDEPSNAHPSAAPATPGMPGEPLYALFDEDHNDQSPASDGFRLSDLREDAQSPSRTDVRSPLAEVSMADLAAMAADDEREERATRTPPRPRPREPEARPLAPAAAPGPSASDDEGEEVFEGGMPGQVAYGSGRSMTQEERSWLKALVIGGVGLIIAVIAFHQLYTVTVTGPAPIVASAEPVEDAPVAAPFSIPATLPPGHAGGDTPQVTLPVRKPDAISKRAGPKAPVSPAAWAEPTDPPAVTPPEIEYGADVEARFRPDWASAEAPTLVPGALVRVRRLADPRDPELKSTLGAALDVIGSGTIEIADDGPFFEDNLRVNGGSRLVRARPGFRPVICLVSPRLETAQEQPALFDVEARTLTLDGIDLIVDAKDLPRASQAIFLCRGGSLTLRRCTLTVLNRGGLPITVIKTGLAEQPSRVHLERTLVRGAFTTAIEIAGNGSDVLISRSAVVNGLGSAVLASGSATPARRVYVSRSVLATRGPAFEATESPTGGRPPVLALRALGSTFSHLPSPAPTSLVTWRGEGAGLSDSVDWKGEANVYAGWPAWLSTGKGRAVRVAGLTAARSVWAGTDSQSQETPEVRPFAVAADRAGPTALRDLAPEVISRVAAPTPMIHEKTLEAFARPMVPGLTDASGNPRPGLDVLTPAPPKGVTPGLRDLTFDADSAPWSGDMGRFLAANVKPGDILVRARATGTGVHPWTPTRLPDGTSLELVVSADAKGRVPSWSIPTTAAGDPALDLRGGSLVLVGVNLTRDGAAGRKRLLRVASGHLVVHRSRLTARGAAEPGGGPGGLIEFRAPGSAPLRPVKAGAASWPFGVPIERPTCRVTGSILITNGEAVSAEVGRGLVAFSQCAVAAGASAFTLRPGHVARHRFEADLWLDHCTIAAEGSIVSLGPWPGAEPGPDRPWLVASHRSGFFGTYDRKTQETVMLRAEPESFASGALFWQSSGDAYEVPRFAVAADAGPPVNLRPDVARHWADFWGRAHVHGATGPRPPGGAMTRRLVNRVLKPGDVTAGDLFLDPAYPKDDPPRDLGADLGRLGVKPANRGTRPR